MNLDKTRLKKVQTALRKKNKINLKKKNWLKASFLGALYDGMKKKKEFSIVGQVLHFAHLIIRIKKFKK